MSISETNRPQWQDRQIVRFWDYWAHRTDKENWFFSYHVGDAIARSAEWFGVLNGNVLDYGCAQGHLLDHLLQANVSVQALEFSHEAVSKVNERYSHRDRWHGAIACEKLPSNLPDDSFDLITCVEVVEHLKDEWLADTLKEIYRLLKPGGYLLLTTPNEEVLEHEMIFCPFCDSEFHSAQHVRKFSAESLSALLHESTFDVLFCKGIDFRRFQLSAKKLWLRMKSPRFFAVAALSCFARMFDRILGRTKRPGWAFRIATNLPGPHLCVIARKSKESSVS